MARPQKKWLRQRRTILFVDESGFYLLPHVVKTWSPRGERPVLLESGSKRKAHLSVAAAITPQGKMYMMPQEEAFNSEGVIRFLKHLMFCIPGNRKLGIVWDGASIHRSEAVREFLREGAAKRIELVRLPPYAPELNPVEAVWSILKRFYLRNFSAESLFALRNLLTNAARALSSRPERIKACFGQAGCY